MYCTCASAFLSDFVYHSVVFDVVDFTIDEILEYLLRERNQRHEHEAHQLQQSKVIKSGLQSETQRAEESSDKQSKETEEGAASVIDSRNPSNLQLDVVDDDQPQPPPQPQQQERADAATSPAAADEGDEEVVAEVKDEDSNSIYDDDHFVLFGE